MTHRRTEIRQAIAAALNTGALAGRVTTSRARPTEAAELPVAIVYTMREQSALANQARALSRVVSVAIDIRGRASVDLDDELDALCAVVEEAMEQDPKFGRLAIASFLASTTIGFDGEGESQQAVASLEYQVTYRTGG